jgi:GntR family transcriptional regulator
MAAIDSPRSQYVQIADLVRSRIADGTYPPGKPLPSEDRLADELQVSRVTINRAIGLLRSSGDVRVRRGIGTVVRTLPRITRDAQDRYAARGQGTGAGQVEIAKLDLRSRTDYGEIGKTTPPPAVAKLLKLGKSAALVRRRVLYANDEPTQIADSYLPWSLTKECPALLQPDSGRGGSYGRLAEIGYGPVRFTEDVDVRTPTEPEQQTLDLEPTQAVFEVCHVAYTAEDRPIEVCIHVMPGHLWTLRYQWHDQPDLSTS